MMIALCFDSARTLHSQTLFSAALTSPAGFDFLTNVAQDDLGSQEAQLREMIQREPNNAVSLTRLGSVLAMENKFEESAQYFEKALKLDPGDLQTRRSLGTDYWQLGQPEKAQTSLEMVLKANPRDTLAMFLLGMVSGERGDYTRAASLLGETLPFVKQRREAIEALARAYYHLGERERARSTLQMLVGYPDGPEAAFQGGRLAAEFKDYDTAESLFLSIQTTYPDAGAVNYNLALAQFSAKRYKSCEKTLLSSIGYGHATADSYALLGLTYENENRMEDMGKAFEKAINTDPSNPAHFLDFGEALVEKKNYGAALEVAKEAVKRFPSSSPAYALKGSAELKMYLLTEALKSYTEAVAMDPHNPRAALGLALTQWNMDRNDDATKSFEQGARDFPNDAFFLLKYALFLLNSPGERDAQAKTRIRNLLKKSEELDAANSETHYQLGNLAIQESKYDEALNELQTAAKLDPEVAKVHLLLARVYRRTGHEKEAEKETELQHELKAKEEQGVDATAAIGTRHP